MEVVEEFKKELEQVKGYGASHDKAYELIAPCIKLVAVIKYQNHQRERRYKEASCS